MDELENGELAGGAASSFYPGRRRRRQQVPAEEEIDIIGENGLSDIEEQLESEEREALKELRRRVRRMGME